MNALKHKIEISRDKIIEDISKSIARGSLKPGDKLIPVRQMIHRYRVSQPIVMEALQHLIRRGIVEKRPRSGCYVKKTLKQNYPVQDTGKEDGLPADGSELLNLNYFLSPRKKEKVLTFYVTDSYPSSLKLWDEVVADFNQNHPGLKINIISCRDGHIEDLISQRDIDVVHTSLNILSNQKTAVFLPIKLEEIGIKDDEILPPARKHFHWNPLKGHFVPFSLTLQYLYINTDLLSQLKTGGYPKTVEDMHAMALDFERRHAAPDEYGMILGELLSHLLLYGALSLSPNGNAEMNQKRTVKFLELVRESHLKCLNDKTLYMHAKELVIAQAFVSGKLLFFQNGSYFAQLLEDQASFGWKAAVLPSAPNSGFESHLSILAVNEQTSMPDEALSLIEYLCSKDVQRKFMGLHGNLPVYSEMLGCDKNLKGHPVAGDVIAETLDKSDRYWVNHAVFENLREVFKSCGYRFFTGQNNVEKTFERLAFHVSNHNKGLVCLQKGGMR